MTDELMDQRLREAGARWRSASAPAGGAVPPPVDLGSFDMPPHRRRPRAWIAAAAGVAAVAAAVAVAVVFSGGGSRTPAPVGADVGALVGTTWRISGSEHEGAPTAANGLPPQHVAAATLLISKDGRITGTDGCNSFSGTVAIRGDHLVFGNLLRTERACANTQSTVVEGAVDNVLTGDVTWSIKGNRLTITGRHGELDYVPAAPNDPDDLYGTVWSLETIEHESATSGSGSGSSNGLGVTLQFIPGAVGSKASYRVDFGCAAWYGDEVQIGISTMTFDGMSDGHENSGCNAGAAAQVVRKTLASTVHWSVENNALKLSQGGTTLTFTATPGGPGHPTTATSSPAPSATAPVHGGVLRPSDMLGTDWTLTDIRQTVVGKQVASGGGPVSNVEPIGLAFDRHGGFQVSSRCGKQAGSVSIGSGTATFSELHWTDQYNCPPDSDPADAQDEQAVDQVLGGQAEWAIANGQLSLTRGGTTLIFDPA